MKYFKIFPKIPTLPLGLVVLPIFYSINAQAVLEFYPQNTPTPSQTTINPSPVIQPAIKPIPASKGSEYYTIPKQDNDTEINISHDTQGNQVYNPTEPNNELYQIPDRAVPPMNTKPTASKNTTKPPVILPQKSVTAPISPSPTSQASKSPAKTAPVKEKIVPTVKKVNLKFSDFPAKVYTGKRVTPNLASLKNLNSFYGEMLADKGAKGEKQFIQSLSKAKPNYAGHYVINSFACGLNCTASVAYDVKTGDFMELGGGFADCPASDFNPRQKANITHQANSRLLIVIGATTTGNCIAGYFEEKNGNVSLISQKNLMTYVP